MRDGYAIVEGAGGSALLERLRDRFAPVREGRRGGLRDVLETREVREALMALRPLAGELAGMQVRCVRGIVFDKTPAANWKVAWHQDRSIAVCERVDAPGFGPWSSKDGVVHVEPPPAILERMVTLRLHLDDCGEANGPLRVIPGSHRHGILTDHEIASIHSSPQCREVTLTCRAGDVIAMRPLLLHASSAALTPSRRRVVHLEFSGDSLPEPLAWRWSN